MVPTGEWEVNLETDFAEIYSHITTTANPQPSAETYTEGYAEAKANFVSKWPTLVVLLSSTIFLSLLQKIQFNAFAALKKREQVPIDKWQKMDVIFAGTSLALVLVLASLPIEMFEDEATKHWISYGVVGVSLV